MHGVNLDTLGRRDPAIYGSETLPELEVRVKGFSRQLGLEVSFWHTNHEGEFCELLHKAPPRADALLLNCGAWTHYSYAIRDALEVAALPAVEVHISNVEEREEWRRRSVILELCLGRVQGRGVEGYRDALGMLKEELSR
jgi:3-dehydroquinate dehydratase-2